MAAFELNHGLEDNGDNHRDFINMLIKKFTTKDDQVYIKFLKPKLYGKILVFVDHNYDYTKLDEKRDQLTSISSDLVQCFINYLADYFDEVKEIADLLGTGERIFYIYFCYYLNLQYLLRRSHKKKNKIVVDMTQQLWQYSCFYQNKQLTSTQRSQVKEYILTKAYIQLSHFLSISHKLQVNNMTETINRLYAIYQGCTFISNIVNINEENRVNFSLLLRSLLDIDSD